MACKSEKNVDRYSYCVTKKFQTVFNAMKRERPWDIRSVNKMYTAAKEKYMIELIKDGHDLSDETINHVVGRCYKFHEFDDGKYVCWFGFILTRKEYPCDHFLCQSFHYLNQRLICHNGGIYYPVDILLNPFGEWQPDTTNMKPEIKEVYDMVQQKWPERWYEDELHKYTLKYLINLIESGEILTEGLKKHVVEGCDKNYHRLDCKYYCCSGFLVRKRQTATNACFRFRGGMLNYVMNSKFYDQTGISDIPVDELRFRKYQTAQKVTSEIISSPCMQNVQNIYERILRRDFMNPKLANQIRLTCQEQYLIEQMKSNEDISNEVISHVLDGCYAWGHLLTDTYACCRGYILKRELFFSHDVENCVSHHTVNKDLKCYSGRIYKHSPEIPHGRRETFEYHHYFKRRKMAGTQLVRSGAHCRIGQMISDVAANLRLPPRPAPPPLDHLDNQPDAQQPIALHFGQNPVVGNIRLDENEIDDEAVVRNIAPNRHLNAATPPPEVDI